VSEPFRYLMRVRYGECDAQGIVFNARWGEYVDLAAGEYTRQLFGSADPLASDFDCRLVKQTMEWHAPARFDDVLELRVTTTRIGTTSYTTATQIHRFSDGTHLADCETVYVCVLHGTATKRPVPDRHRALLERGAPGVVVDHAAALPR
jgi:acyl-CoA thioester hydrolase